MPDRDTVRRALIAVLEHVQKSGNYPILTITDTTRPLEDLEGFDSHMGIIATSLLAAALGIPIPVDRNIFRAEGTTRKLTLKEVVDVVVKIAA